jgi:uncharacterized membrane protein YidH (DUF202 family)
MDRDPGLAFERTSLAWHRTGLSALALAAVALKALQHRPLLGVPLSAVFAVVAVVAYVTGASTPAPPARLRAISLVVTLAAVLTGVCTIVG